MDRNVYVVSGSLCEFMWKGECSLNSRVSLCVYIREVVVVVSGVNKEKSGTKGGNGRLLTKG